MSESDSVTNGSNSDGPIKYNGLSVEELFDGLEPLDRSPDHWANEEQKFRFIRVVGERLGYDVNKLLLGAVIQTIEEDRSCFPIILQEFMEGLGSRSIYYLTERLSAEERVAIDLDLIELQLRICEVKELARRKDFDLELETREAYGYWEEHLKYYVDDQSTRDGIYKESLEYIRGDKGKVIENLHAIYSNKCWTLGL